MRAVRHAMSVESATRILRALNTAGVNFSVGGGWAIDALVGRETRPHADLDLWVPAEHLEPLIPVAVDLGVDRLLPWGGDRPWVFVLHDGEDVRVDLHLYEDLGDGWLHYGSVLAGYRLERSDLQGRGTIGDVRVPCETPECALRHKSGHVPRDIDKEDIALLYREFDLQPLPNFK